MNREIAAKSPRSGKTKKSLVTQAYEELKRRILDNHLPPGFQAAETAVAKMLNMSRTPVREALVHLEREGLVKIVPRHGMRVLSVSAEQLCEIYQILTALETMVVQILAERKPNSEEVTVLREQVNAMKKALKRGDLEAWAAADERFHELLVSQAGNSRLTEIALMYRDQTHRARAITLRLRPAPRKSTDHHAEVIEAIARGDVEAAKKIHWDQRTRSYRELTELISRFNITQL